MAVSRLKIKTKRILTPDNQRFCLRIACAYQPRDEGFIGIDSIAGDAVDHVIDLTPPWPIDDSCVDTITSAFYFHRLDNNSRWAFMNECWRILKPNAQVILIMPHWSSMRAITDPLAKWPPLCESSFMVYSHAWREREKMQDLPLDCDFGDTYGYGTSVDPDISIRNDEYQAQARKHWINANMDLHITLTAVK